LGGIKKTPKSRKKPKNDLKEKQVDKSDVNKNENGK
jgi:hypothetical protein